MVRIERLELLLFADRTDRIVASIIEAMINEDSTKILEKFLPSLKAYEQRKYLNAIITFVANRYLSSSVESKDDAPLKASPSVSGVARLLRNIVHENELLREHIVTILTRSSVPALDDSLAARRSIIAAIAQDEGKLARALLNAILTYFR